MNEPESTHDLETRILRKVYTWMVVGGVTIGGVGGTGLVRYDKYGASDAELKHSQMVLEFDRKIWNVQRSVKPQPPQPTRQRIRAIERCLERNCTDFEPPSQDW